MLLALVAGCSGTVTTQGDTAGQGASSSQAGSGGTGGGDPVGGCAPGAKPYDGPLCGPAAMPCTVQIHEVLPSPASGHNDAPAIAVDELCSPAALYTSGGYSYQGHFARRVGANDWQEEETPFDIATGGLVFDDGSPVTLVNDDAYGASLWKRGAAGWESIAQVPGEIMHWARGFVKRGPSQYHVAAMTSSDQLVLGTFENGGWSVDDVGSFNAPYALYTEVDLGLSPAGAPHLSYWNHGDPWRLEWIAPPGASETVVPTTTDQLQFSYDMQSIVVTAPNGANPAGVPHVFTGKPLLGGQGNSLVLATRESGAWVETTIDAETPDSYEFCDTIPSGFGEKCNYDIHWLVPLHVVGVPGGHVRALYADYHFMRFMLSWCGGSGATVCWWEEQSDTSTYEIRVGWIEPDGTAATASLLSDVWHAGHATAVVDTMGAIHLLLYGSLSFYETGSVHYLRIGP